MNDMDEPKGDTRYNIRVLDRAIRLLSLLSDGIPRTPVEISEGIGLSSSTTFRILATLTYYNLIKRDEKSGEFSLGLACLELARAYQDTNDLRRVALQELHELRDEVKETVHMCILDKMEIVYVEKIDGLHAIGIMSSRIGGRAPPIAQVWARYCWLTRSQSRCAPILPATAYTPSQVQLSPTLTT